MADQKTAAKDRLVRLMKYADGLKQRLSGDLDKAMREFLERDLHKTESTILKLRL